MKDGSEEFEVPGSWSPLRYEAGYRDRGLRVIWRNELVLMFVSVMGWL